MKFIIGTGSRMALSLLVLLFAFSYRSFAGTINVVSSAASTGILDPSSDSFSLDPTSVTVDTDSDTFVFQTGYFHVDYSNIPDQVILFSFQDTITIDGVTQNLLLQGQDNVTTSADTLTIFAGGPFIVGDRFYAVHPLTVTTPTIGDIPAQLAASVVTQLTPEPGSIFLLGTGLLIGGLLGLKKFQLR